MKDLPSVHQSIGLVDSLLPWLDGPGDSSSASSSTASTRWASESIWRVLLRFTPCCPIPGSFPNLLYIDPWVLYSYTSIPGSSTPTHRFLGPFPDLLYIDPWVLYFYILHIDPWFCIPFCTVLIPAHYVHVYIYILSLCAQSCKAVTHSFGTSSGSLLIFSNAF
eukprot:sb/3472639/